MTATQNSPVCETSSAVMFSPPGLVLASEASICETAWHRHSGHPSHISSGNVHFCSHRVVSCSHHFLQIFWPSHSGQPTQPSHAHLTAHGAGPEPQLPRPLACIALRATRFLNLWLPSGQSSKSPKPQKRQNSPTFPALQPEW